MTASSAPSTAKTAINPSRPLTDTEIDATAGGFLWIPVVVIPFWIGAKIRLAIDPKAGEWRNGVSARSPHPVGCAEVALLSRAPRRPPVL